jgi:hypothetical protein
MGSAGTGAERESDLRHPRTRRSAEPTKNAGFPPASIEACSLIPISLDDGQAKQQGMWRHS